MKKCFAVEVSDIKYDTSRSVAKTLPKSIVYSVLIDETDVDFSDKDAVEDYITDEVSDRISDDTGYCHDGFVMTVHDDVTIGDYGVPTVEEIQRVIQYLDEKSLVEGSWDDVVEYVQHLK